MPTVKQQVGPFELKSKTTGSSYRYEYRTGWNMVYSVEIHDGSPCEWEALAGGYWTGNGRKPEQAQSIERYGVPSHCADSFQEAKTKAYKFMEKFYGSPGYNGLLDLAAAASWRHESHGKYGGG
jgi:hypothetical protein